VAKVNVKIQRKRGLLRKGPYLVAKGRGQNVGGEMVNKGNSDDSLHTPTGKTRDKGVPNVALGLSAAT